MVHFVLTILAIALTSAMLYVTVSYVNPSLTIAREVEQQVESGFLTLNSALDDFESLTGAPLATGGGWAAQLTPQYGFMPRPPLNTEWRYGAAGAGTYLCLAPVGGAASVTEAQYDGMRRFQNRISAQQGFISTSNCGATGNAAKPAVWPASVYFTYWVTPY